MCAVDALRTSHETVSADLRRIRGGVVEEGTGDRTKRLAVYEERLGEISRSYIDQQGRTERWEREVSEGVRILMSVFILGWIEWRESCHISTEVWVSGSFSQILELCDLSFIVGQSAIWREEDIYTHIEIREI
ncbi:hypothetical protein Tco_1122042 [Tanacetum coccineum]|uniref:Uncharacterized protein n=1 Tax=Tanacetum coccineum TaxID=301880 RepID=A0ABQ5J1Q3_9ASTR